MTEQEAISQAAAKYRAEGYAVTLNPDPAALPTELRNRHPAMLATRNGTSVVVEVWSRDKVNDLPPTFLPPGWEFDVISLPPAASPAAPGPGPAATPEFTRQLLTELEDFLPKGAPQARFLLAWSAVESAMRVAAGRVGLDPTGIPPRQLMSELVSAGMLSQDQYARLNRQFASRNRIAHGLPAENLDPHDVGEMVAVARELIAGNEVTAA
jgi:hypothetical protein